MSSKTARRSAEELSSKAEGNIKTKHLIDATTRPVISLGSHYLSNRPIISYFAEDEQPHYIVFNLGYGVQIGKRVLRSNWWEEYRNAMWVSNRGLHFTFGRPAGMLQRFFSMREDIDDFHRFISYQDVVGFELVQGGEEYLLENYRFILETSKNNYQFPTHLRGGLIDDVAKYIRSQLSQFGKEHSNRESGESDSTNSDSQSSANRETGESKSANSHTQSSSTDLSGSVESKKEAYRILDATPTESHEEIRAKYREKVKEAHPDSGGTVEEFKMVREAYSRIIEE